MRHVMRFVTRLRARLVRLAQRVRRPGLVLRRPGVHATTFVVACTIGLAGSAWLRARVARAHARPDWTTLLAPAPVRRLRAVIVVEARDCPATLATLELFARPDLAAAVGSVTLLVRDGRDSLARYADARLTAGVQVAVVPVPPAFRRSLRTLGAGPRLLLVDPAGQVAWASRIDPATRDAPSFPRALAQVADHYLATELASSRPQP